MASTLEAAPSQRLLSLDAVWIQVAGTRCNLTCTHCFVSAGPDVHRHEFLSRETVRRHVADGLALGAREFYFTGGEPFLHPELIQILEDTLAVAPCTVLTNGTLLTHARTAALHRLFAHSRYSLEIRVSFDGASAAEHDALRGPGRFRRTLGGLLALERTGLLPIATVTMMSREDPLGFRERFADTLRAAGVRRPRIKLLPLFSLGRELERTPPDETLATLDHLSQSMIDERPLPCGTCRAVTSQGVFVCPLLVDEPSARLGASLAEARQPYALRNAACATCWSTGATCAN